MTSFKFCPKCGQPLQEKEIDNRQIPVCTNPNCGFIFWQSANPCTIALISNDRGELLLTRRGIEPDQGKLDFPGGFMNIDEEPIESVKREVREELGVEITVGDTIGYCIDEYGDAETINLIIGFAATITSGDPYPADPKEITEVVWCDPATLTAEELAFTNNERFVHLWQKYQQR